MQYNGTNLLKVIADDPTAYVRHLLDIMFTKDEQKKSLLYKSEKSSKPELDQEKVSLLFGKLVPLVMLFFSKKFGLLSGGHKNLCLFSTNNLLPPNAKQFQLVSDQVACSCLLQFIYMDTSL